MNAKNEEFRKKYKVEKNPNKSNVSQINENPRYKYYSKEKLNATKQSGKLSKKRRSAKLRKTFRTLLAAGLVTVTAYGANEYYIKPVTLQEALDAGKSLKDLGLNEDIVNELKQIQSTLSIKDELSKEEIKELGKDLENIELEVVKEKVGRALDTEALITLTPRDSNFLESTISFYDEKSNKDRILLEGEDYESVIGSQIERIRSLQIANDAYYTGMNSREDILKIYEKSLEEVSRFASSEITENEKGKLKVDQITRASLEKENESKKVASIEDEGR